MKKDHRNHDLKALNLHSDVPALLRALYRMLLDYCVLKPSKDPGDVVVFTKDRLISIIERNGTEISVGDIPGMAAEGLFKTVPIPKIEGLRVLVVGEDGADVLPAGRFLSDGDVSFPVWWEAPVPLALRTEEKFYFNPKALSVFGGKLKRISSKNTPDMPGKEEFLVKLEEEDSSRVWVFRCLEDNIYTLEDCTEDVAAAEEITWWAAVGRAWAEELDRGKRPWRRCEESERESLESSYRVLSCEWEGERLGCFCVKNAPVSRGRGKSAAKSPAKKTPPKETRKAKKAPPQSGGDAADPLRLLGPQAMGLLAAGTDFTGSPQTPEAGVENDA